MHHRLQMVFLILLLFLPQLCNAQYFTQGKDLIRAFTPETVGRKALSLNLGLSTAYRQVDITDQTSELISSNHLTVSAVFGLTNWMDIMAEITPWQDDYTSEIAGPIGANRVGLKLKLPQHFGRNIYFGLLGTFIHSPADIYHSPIEEFSVSGTGFSGSVLHALDIKPGGIPIKLYANGGYQIWNDSGDQPLPFDKFDQILISGGIKVSFRKLVLMAEYSREQFVESDSLSSSEQSQRVIGSFRLPLSKSISLDLGYQKNLSKDDKETPFFADYYDWRFIVGLKKIFYFEMDEEKRNRMLLMDRIRQEESERLKSLEQERKETEKEIDELKKMIQEESK